MSVLVIVCALSLAIGLVAVAVHSLWRGSSRGLFGVEEHRELVNLCHSAIAEELWAVETRLEQGASLWVDWCTTTGPAPDREEDVAVTQGYLAQLTGEHGNLTYSVSKVKLQRVEGASLAAGMSGKLGVIDFVVTVQARRAMPAHQATLQMTRRHAFWFSDGLTPFMNGGRHIEILPTPVATFLEFP